MDSPPTAPTALPKPFSKKPEATKERVVAVSAARLEQLLEAEVTSLSLRAAQPLTLKNILDLADSAEPGHLAEFLHEELPVRFAQRIRMLEELPDWQSKVSIASVRQMYVTSFKELRLADPREPAQFQLQLRNIKERHAQTNLLVGGFRAYAATEEMKSKDIDGWLERFFALRISTNMLMSHYLQMSKPTAGSIDTPFDGESFNPYLSSIDPKCNPARIARHAAHLVSDMARGRYGAAPRIEVTDNGSEAFPFVPRYMLYILSELLKNAVRATVETHCSTDCQTIEPDEVDKIPPITVLVSGDENVLCCRVSDEGGGIAMNMLPKVWSYLFSTAHPINKPLTRLAVDAPPDPRRIQHREVLTPSSEDEVQSVLFKSPLAGLGCGLPLSRLYATYLGGNVELQSLPRYGSDIFVYLNRLGDSSELLLPHH